MSVHSMNLKGLQSVLVEKWRRENAAQNLHYLSQAGNDASPTDRDRAVRWLMLVVDEFPFQPRTFALAIHIFDQFLGFVKVPARYLKCAALTALHVATKVVEEDIVIPSMLQLIKAADARFGPNDMVRMEKIILSKLDWDIGKPTSYDFLELFICILYNNVKDLFAVRGITPELLLEDLWAQLQECIILSKFTQFRGSTVALALVSCALERLHPTWFSIVNTYQSLTQVPVAEFLKCREFIKAMFAMTRRPKVAKKRSVLRRPLLTPIPENPFEAEYMAASQKREAADHVTGHDFKGHAYCSDARSSRDISQDDLERLKEEFRRLQRIELYGDASLPAAKRPRFHALTAAA